MQYDVFIAHPSERKDAARACAEALRARGLRPFVDEQTTVGAVWAETLRRTQEGCRASIVLWYPGLEAGPYLRDEVETALLRHRQFGHLVFPVWLGEPKGERLPYGLSGFQAAVVGGDWGELAAEVGRQLEDPVYAREHEIAALEEQLVGLREAGGDTGAVAKRLRELKRARRVDEVPTRLGDWQVIEPIGKGGFATVYLAKPAGRVSPVRVAIKVLHADRATHAESVARFCSGSCTMRDLEHEGVVRVREWATAEMKDTGPVYFVMDHVDGGDLQRRVAEGLPPEAGVELVLQAARALHHAHEQGRVHRDVKPANILVGRDGRARLTDFDLVLAEESTHGTRTGAALGTVMYAAPEQLESAGRVDRRADVYGLGMVLAFVLSGGRLTAREVMFRRERFLAGLPCSEGMRAVVRRATEPEEEERTGDMLVLVREVEEARREGAERGSGRAEPVAAGETERGPAAVAAPEVDQPARSSGVETSPTPTAPVDLVQALRRAAEDGRWREVQEVARRLADVSDVALRTARVEDGEGVRSTGEAIVAVRRRLAVGGDRGSDAWLAGLALDALLGRIGAGDEERVRRVGEVVCEPVGLPFVYIPGGSFLMGRRADPPKGSLDAASNWADELPQHRVTLSPFAMSVTPVTQAQWRAVEAGLNTRPSFFRDKPDSDQRPVEQVSWFDAVRWCNALSVSEGRRPFYLCDSDKLREADGRTWEQYRDDEALRERLADAVTLDPTGTGYRLPTEAEWEYACRAGTQTSFYSGETEADLTRVGWYGNQGNPGGNSGGETHPVRQKEPNAWGLYDLHGNVWEWCGDWGLGDYPREAVTDPTGPSRGGRRVVRGGSWWFDPVRCRSAYRNWVRPVNRYGGLGFRVVLPLSPPPRQ